jgi:hypothetical protein
VLYLFRFQVNLNEYPLIQKVHANLNDLEAFQRATPETQIDNPTTPA